MRKNPSFPRLLEPEARKEISYCPKVWRLSRLSLCLTFGHRTFRAGVKGANRYFSQRGNCSALGNNLECLTSIQNKPAKPKKATTKKQPSKSTTAKSTTGTETTTTDSKQATVERLKSATTVNKATATTKKVQAAKAKPFRKSTTSQHEAVSHLPTVVCVTYLVFPPFFR